MEEFPDYEPFIFELANGNTIAVMATIEAPEDFDAEDDSQFNDQNE
jgi:hypothetical protein